MDGRRLDEWANQFFIAQESTLSYDSTLLSLLYESASPTVRIRFMPATSIHDSATGEAFSPAGGSPWKPPREFNSLRKKEKFPLLVTCSKYI